MMLSFLKNSIFLLMFCLVILTGCSRNNNQFTSSQSFNTEYEKVKSESIEDITKYYDHKLASYIEERLARIHKLKKLTAPEPIRKFTILTPVLESKETDVQEIKNPKINNQNKKLLEEKKQLEEKLKKIEEEKHLELEAQNYLKKKNSEKYMSEIIKRILK